MHERKFKFIVHLSKDFFNQKKLWFGLIKAHSYPRWLWGIITRRISPLANYRWISKLCGKGLIIKLNFETYVNEVELSSNEVAGHPVQVATVTEGHQWKLLSNILKDLLISIETDTEPGPVVTYPGKLWTRKNKEGKHSGQKNTSQLWIPALFPPPATGWLARGALVKENPSRTDLQLRGFSFSLENGRVIILRLLHE